jgi:PAS domain S-box-containing protein
VISRMLGGSDGRRAATVVPGANGRAAAAVEDGAAERSARALGAAVLARLAEAVVVIRADDGRIVYANTAFEQLAGRGRAQLVGRHLSSLSAPSDQFPEERVREILAALAHGGVWSGDVHFRHRDGSELWCSARVSGLEDPEQGAIWIVTCSAAAERRAAEAALADAEARFRAVFENGHIPIVLVGSDLRVLDVNGPVCALTGFARDELLERSLAHVTHPGDVAVDADLARRLFAGEIPGYRVEKRLLTVRGTPIDVAVTSTAVRGPDGRPAYAMATIEELPRRASGRRRLSPPTALGATLVTDDPC